MNRIEDIGKEAGALASVMDNEICECQTWEKRWLTVCMYPDVKTTRPVYEAEMLASDLGLHDSSFDNLYSSEAGIATQWNTVKQNVQILCF